MKRNPIMFSEEDHQNIKANSMNAGMPMGTFILHLNRIYEERTTHAYRKFFNDRELLFQIAAKGMSNLIIFGGLHLVDVGVISENDLRKLLLTDSGRTIIGNLLDEEGIEAKKKAAEIYDIPNNDFI